MTRRAGRLTRFGAWRLALAAAVIVTAQTAAMGQPSSPTAEHLRETREELDRARSGLESVEAQVGSVAAQLQVIDTQLAAASRELAALHTQLGTARDAHLAAAARTAELTVRLESETQRLERVVAELQERERRFGRRVAATYKYGTVSYADAFVQAQDFSDFVTSYHYVRSALDFEEALIDEVSALTQEVRQQRAEVHSMRQDAVEQRQTAAEAEAEVRRLTQEQRALTERVAADRAERAKTLSELEASRESHEQLVSTLQAESDRLAAELRRSQWRAGAAPGAGTLAWPTDGRPGSGYGWRTHPIFGTQRFHAGVDIAGPIGQPIVAAADGLVVGAGYRGGYGLTVVIDHGGGLATLYAHQSRLAVSPGQLVKRAEKIGEIGSTGFSTGPHLHYEVRVGGEPQDPMRWY
ncbi:MAG: peptidoglycan DD-metalloendopeptidase family protein [Actinobacteria bacterium]|nr:peptidoglycan DD-metalloendopeptidase family protein [Actinomycetota bacterium]